MREAVGDGALAPGEVLGRARAGLLRAVRDREAVVGPARPWLEVRSSYDRAVRARYGGRFPWGTFAVNVAASLVLGVLAGAATAAAVSTSLQALVGAGFCGALSTLSTFAFETVRAAEVGARRLAGVYLVASVVVGLAAAVAGSALGEQLAR